MAAFFDRYAAALLYVIRARMTRELRSAWDSEDFVQYTRIKTHLCDLASKHFETPRAFLAYVSRIAQDGVQQAKRKHRLPQKPLDGLTQAEEGQLVDRTASPGDVEATEETWRHAIADLSPDHKMIAEWLREGYTQVKIARELNISDRTVRRVLQALRDGPRSRGRGLYSDPGDRPALERRFSMFMRPIDPSVRRVTPWLTVRRGLITDPGHGYVAPPVSWPPLEAWVGDTVELDCPTRGGGFQSRLKWNMSWE